MLEYVYCISCSRMICKVERVHGKKNNCISTVHCGNCKQLNTISHIFVLNVG